MALILDTDLLCVERGGRSYKWSGAELKGQVGELAPVGQLSGTLPIIVTQVNRDATISIRTASTSQSGATTLTNTIDNNQTKAVTPKGVNDTLGSKANADGSNASGTWPINISGTSGSSTNATNASNVQVDTESSTNSNRYIVFADDGGGTNRRMKIDGGLVYNPSTNTLTTGTFKGNLNGTASNASTADNATNATTATNATNVNILSDSSNANRYLNFSASTSGNSRVRANSSLYCNPSTGTLYATNITADTLTLTNGLDGSIITGGDITCRNLTATGIINNSSDFNLKEDIEVITGAVESLKQINGVNFTWKSNKGKSMGVIAQDVEKVFPDIVNTDEDGLKAVNYNGIIGALVEAVKELSARVEELEASK